MPSYIVLTQNNRHRILRSTADGAATGLTTVTDGEDAKRIAAALTRAVTDLPRTLVQHLPGDLPDPHDWYYDTSDDLADDWCDLPADTTPVDLRRAALNTFDHGIPATVPGTVSPPRLYTVDTLRGALTGQPTSVVRAVRDELAAAFAPYVGVPVVGRLYDRKWHDADELILVNAGLSLLADDQVAKLSGNPESSDPGDLLEALERAGLADFRDLDDIAEQGYLTLGANRSQLAAWLAARDDARTA